MDRTLSAIAWGFTIVTVIAMITGTILCLGCLGACVQVPLMFISLFN